MKMWYYDESDEEDFTTKYQEELESLVRKLNDNCKNKDTNLNRSDWSLSSFSIKIDNLNISFDYDKMGCNMDYFCCDSCTKYESFFCDSCRQILEDFSTVKMKKIREDIIEKMEFTEKNFELMKQFIIGTF
jgi:hypothetical protein